MAKLSKTYEEYVEVVKKTKEFEGRTHKTYHIKKVTEESVLIEDPETGLNVDLYLKGMYNAAESVGVENCTVDFFEQIALKEAAPFMADFIYAIFEIDVAIASVRSIFGLMHDAVADEISTHDPNFEPCSKHEYTNQDATATDEDEKGEDADSDEK